MSPEYESSSVLLRRSALQHGLAGQAALEGEFVPRAKLFLAEAREILAAMEAAKARGEGATVYKGRLVDIASIKQAEVIVKQAELMKLDEELEHLVRRFHELKAPRQENAAPPAGETTPAG